MFLRSFLTSLLALTVLSPAIAQSISATPSWITDGWQLLVDDHLIERTEGVTRTYHAFRKDPQNPIIRADAPWEGQTIYLYGTVLPRETAPGFRMWYHAWADNEYRMLYAESDDGLRWNKPALGLTEYNGSVNNNILFRRTHENHNPQVMFTPSDPNPDMRYKMVYFEYGRTPPTYTKTGYRGAYSPDGVHWTDTENNPVLLDDPGDVGNFVWDPIRSRYLGYPKKFADVRGFRRRCVGYSETTTFEQWPASELIITPDEFDDRWVTSDGQHTDFYGLCGFPYQNLYLGFLWIFRITDGKNDGPIYVELVSSRDGMHWKRQDEPRTPILPLGDDGTWDDGMLFTPNHPILVGDTIRMYYGGFDGTHGADDASAAIGLATMRKDRFVSLDAGAQRGTVTTKPLLHVRGTLRLNCSADAGSIEVEVLDHTGNPIPGFTAAESTPVSVDGIDQPVHWGDRTSLPTTSGPVQIRFTMENAALYAFHAGEFVAPVASSR